MKSDAESNLLKAKNYLKINNIEYHELHPNTHFRIFIGRIPYSHREGFIDLWPTTLKWYDFKGDIGGNDIESFVNQYKMYYAIKNTNTLRVPSGDQPNKNVKYPRKPEKIIQSDNVIAVRFKVPKGWILEIAHDPYKSSSIVFVPDENHDWILEPEDNAKAPS